MKKNLITSITLLAFLFTWSACGDDRATVTSADFQFNFKINNENLELNKTYELDGTTVIFETARFYVGGIEFQSAANPNVIFEDQYLLVNAAQTDYTVGELTFQDYDKIKFFIGVEPSINSQSEDDFTTRATTDPLGIQSPSMHWNWNSGYKFIRVDGQTDTDGDGVVDSPLAFHIGNNEFLSNLEFTAPSIQEGVNTIQFTMDLNKLFSGIDLSTDWETHTGNNLPLANQFNTNFKTALSIN